ncbi:unnamed protein product [Calicophoron daubneyi]|uniref:Fibronectin type-III domain-containing protein n=1 Tax=Calicophoron daubneyi TaxID=300641 RepID=A0AAV2SWC7_CALDB
MNTTKPALVLTDLRPSSHYDVYIYSVNLLNSRKSREAVSLSIKTNPMVYRPEPVTDLRVEANKFRTLNISWKPPPPPKILIPQEQIVLYRVSLFNLHPTSSTAGEKQIHSNRPRNQPIVIEVRAEASTFTERISCSVTDLTPDSFYQVSVQAVTASNITGYPAVISSSPRIPSRPPSKSPIQVRVHSIGARVATVSWQPPPTGSRNGDVIIYRINISCEDWLRPRQIDVVGELSQVLRGLSRATKYELSLSAATRGGNGPDSPTVSFTTLDEENDADKEVRNTNVGYLLSGDDATGDYTSEQRKYPTDGSKFSYIPKSIENLRYIADERSILLLWSPPVSDRSTSASRSQGSVERTADISRYTVKWGTLYPGPSTQIVPANHSRFLIDHLEVDTPYLIEVAAVYENEESAPAMITARTKPALFRHSLLIPLNLHVSSVDSDWAMVEWDEPECSYQPETSNSRPGCLGKDLVHSYQVAYRPIGQTCDPSKRGDEGSSDSKSLDNAPAHVWNTTRTMVKLEDLIPGCQYSVVVRAVRQKTVRSGQDVEPLFSEWSLEQLFETQERGPGDAPREVSVAGLPESSGGGPLRLQVAWQPPQKPNGRLSGYLLYFTSNGSLPLSEWSKMQLPANSLNAMLSNLSPGSIYFIQIRAFNNHRNGPLSPVLLYRTPDIYGQGGGQIPLRGTYYDGQAIPMNLFSSGLINVAPDRDDSVADNPAGLTLVQPQELNSNTKSDSGMSSWLIVTIVTIFALSFLTILLGLILWRRRQTAFPHVLEYKPGAQGDGALEGDRNNDVARRKNITSHGWRRKRSSYPRAAQQEIALLVTNGEAVHASEMQTHHSTYPSRIPPNQVTASNITSVTVPSCSGVTASHGPVLNMQPQAPVRSSSWDKDSDSLQFASVSQQRQINSANSGGLVDSARNATPTPTASGSTASGPGSIGTPTRIAANPTYQTHGTMPFPMESAMPLSYASATLGANPIGPTIILPRSPQNQPMAMPVTNPMVNGVPSNLMMQFYPVGPMPAQQALQISGGGIDRRMIGPPPPYVYPNQANYQGGVMFSLENGHTSPYASMNPQFVGNPHVPANAPRVNAAELLSFNSADDIRPTMSSSVHNENNSFTEGSSSQQESHPPAKPTVSTGEVPVTSARPNTNRTSREKEPNTRSKKHLGTGFITSPVRSTVSTSHVRSPKRRPPPSSRKPLEPEESMPKETTASLVTDDQNEGQVSSPSSPNGDSANSNLNKAFSTEELTQEMANLEGLMKDLSAITREEFNY